MKHLLLLLVIFSSCCATLNPRKSINYNPGRVFVINQDMTDENMAPVILAMEMVVLGADVSPVRIVLNSNGGSHYAAKTFSEQLDLLAARGITIDCVVHDKAYSAAANILLHCTRRQAVLGASIMWHPAKAMVIRPGVTLTQAQLAALAAESEKINTEGLQTLMRFLTDLPPLVLSFMYNTEMFVPAEELAKATDNRFITMTPMTIEILADIMDPATIRN